MLRWDESWGHVLYAHWSPFSALFFIFCTSPLVSMHLLPLGSLLRMLTCVSETRGRLCKVAPLACHKFQSSTEEAEPFSSPAENGCMRWWWIIRLGLPTACKLMQINFLAEEKGKRAGAAVWRAAQRFSCSPLVVRKVQQHEPGRAVVYQATLTKGYTLCQPSSWPGRRADGQSGSPVLCLKRMAWHRGPLVAPPPLPRCTAAA